MTQTSNTGSATAALTFLAGIGAGVAAGLLLAPRNGEETRQQIRNKLAEARDKARQKMEEKKDIVKSKLDDVKDTAGEAVREGREMMEDTHGKMDRRTKTALNEKSGFPAP